VWNPARGAVGSSPWPIALNAENGPTTALMLYRLPQRSFLPSKESSYEK
jgi:hypothetical protein